MAASPTSPPPSKVGEYEIVQLIGSGAFASVYLANHTGINVPVAVKIVPKAHLRNKLEFELLQREVNLIKSMDHPFIAMYYETLEDEKNFYLVQELVENSSLLEFINFKKGISEQEASHFFIQLISVMDYLHNSRRVAHRDLKAENVLIDRFLNVKLVDFGLSKPFTRDNPFLITTCGSPAYVAPEIIRQQPYTAAADIWSCGVLLYAMVIGQLPFYGNNVNLMFQQIISVNPRLPTSLTPELRDLLARLLVKDPASRITIKRIQEHPWITNRIETRIFTDPRPSFQILTPQNLDPVILTEMRCNRYDTSNLAQELTVNQINSKTAVYKMLRRRKILDEINLWQNPNGNTKPILLDYMHENSGMHPFEPRFEAPQPPPGKKAPEKKIVMRERRRTKGEGAQEHAKAPTTSNST